MFDLGVDCKATLRVLTPRGQRVRLNLAREALEALMRVLMISFPRGFILLAALQMVGCGAARNSSLADSRLGGDAVDSWPVDVFSDYSAPDQLLDLAPSPDLQSDTPEALPGEILSSFDLSDSGNELDSMGCDCPPPAVAITVNDIPSDMNGSTTYTNNEGIEEAYHLLLPTWDFVLDLTVDCPCGCAVELVQLAYLADGEQVVMAAAQDALQADGDRVFVQLTEKMALPEADELTLSATVFDLCGEPSAEAALTVATTTRTELLHPFDLEDPWLLVYHRDHYAISLKESADGTFAVTSLLGPNGTDDFLEDLWLVGLGTDDPTAAFAAFECGGAEGGSECLARQLLERIRTKSHLPFYLTPEGEAGPDSVPIRFLIEGEPGAPDPSTFAYQYLQGDETERAFSMMGFGGGDLSESWVGMSESLDVNNTHNENNAKFGYGCFTTSLMRFFYEAIDSDPSLYALAEVALAGILPPMGGVPIGELEGDERVIDFSIPAGELSPAEKSRRLTLDTTMDVLATGLAALNTHETGHSLGLVSKGPPPGGLFGGTTNASFIGNPTGSKGAHIATEGPNLMEAGPGSGNNDSIDIDMLLTPFFFNELNLAYLRGRVLVN